MNPSIPISRNARQQLNLSDERYDDHGFLLIRSRKEARELVMTYAETFSETAPSAGDLYGAGYIVNAWRILLESFAKEPQPYEPAISAMLTDSLGPEESDAVFGDFARDFPSGAARRESQDPKKNFRKWIITHLVQNDPALTPFSALFQNPDEKDDGKKAWSLAEVLDRQLTRRGPERDTPLATLKKPITAAPNSVSGQLRYILTHWGSILGDWAGSLVGVLDMIEEETRPRFFGPGPARGPGLELLDGRARFSRDDDWMPKVVLLAKNVLVWLNQLSAAYGHHIQRLDQVPDEELNLITSRGFNALWLIGLWERSPASREIKRRMGNPQAAASAYSLFGYDIAGELGGWPALDNLKHRAAARGLRISSDMVPNHVGIDSDWVRHHPERLLGVAECPYPAYSFFGDDLSGDGAVDIRVEDHYWDRSDAAVVFQRRDKVTGETLFLYHGNDGTSMPWNDTAQINFLNPAAREAVIQEILHVARNFPIIRFDAAMVIARKHVRRLWFPSPGSGGAIPSRSEHALSDEDFDSALPMEFWREVVDRVAAEAPGTLLLAEAFWMMEGYFVRTLGMHRVYNSAFMNMLRDQKNGEYRHIIKETLAFDPGILQRFVNFMNNPDEETAVKQFGQDDRYFAVCTLLATLPGLPMIGHGQVEGFSEKYGMEYIKALWDESPNSELIARHEREIFPLLIRRNLFAGASSFRLYDLQDGPNVVESVYAFSNASGDERVLVVVNNAYERAAGIIKQSSPVNTGEPKMRHDDLASAFVPDGSSDGDWLLLKNHIAGLWYIRSVGDLRRNGLKIEIDGFGRQVFLDIHVAAEIEGGVWGVLASELGGAGVEDLDGALAEIRLRPVKKALETLLPPGMAHDLADRIREGKKPKRWLERGKAARALTRIRDYGGVDIGDADRAVDKIQQRLEVSAKLWKFLHGGLRRRLSRKFGTPDGDDALFLAVWSILSVPGAGRWHEWNLGGWVRSYIQGPAPEELCRSLGTALSLPDWTEEARRPSRVLAFLMACPEVREACGVNFWEGVSWYNLEGWNAFVRVTILTAAAASMPRRVLRRLIRRWAKAAGAADYRLDRLLNSVR